MFATSPSSNVGGSLVTEGERAELKRLLTTPTFDGAFSVLPTHKQNHRKLIKFNLATNQITNNKFTAVFLLQIINNLLQFSQLRFVYDFAL